MNAEVQLGRTYACHVCGARVMVLRAHARALDLHCCNQAMSALDPPVPVYHCEVCGAEVAVLGKAGADLNLICCNEPMHRLASSVPTAA